MGIVVDPKRLEYLLWIARRKELAEKEREKAAKEKAKKEAAAQRRLSRVKTTAKFHQERLTMIEAMPPTRLAVQLLKEMTVSDKVPTSIRVKAADILLKWGMGEFDGRKGKRNKGTR